MVKRVVLIVLLLLSSVVSAADYDAEIEKFFKLYASGEHAEALESIYRTNPWISSSPDVVQNLMNQLVGAQRLVGRYYGNVHLGKFDVANRFVQITYLALHDRQPLRMEFQFYKPDDEWRIFSFSFDDALDDDVEKAARAAVMDRKP